MGGSRGSWRVELSGRDKVWTPIEDARKRERCWNRHLGRSQKEVQSVSTRQHEQRFGGGGTKKGVASSGWGKVAAPLALNVVARVEFFGQALYYGSAGMGWEVGNGWEAGWGWEAGIGREVGLGCRTGFGSECGSGLMG